MHEGADPLPEEGWSGAGALLAVDVDRIAPAMKDNLDFQVRLAEISPVM
jgi:hypothetical protein